MNDPDPIATVADAPPAEPASAPPRTPPEAPTQPATARGGRGALWLAVVVLLAAVGWLGWREYQRLGESERRAQAWREPVAALDERLAGLEQQIAQSIDPLRRGQSANAQRLNDAAATNKLLREEVLAVSGRAAQLEESIERLSEQRTQGAMLLGLNEAEFLLLMGAARLRLYGDVPATLEAYRLADATLASIEDPIASTLRETLAQELNALTDLPRDPVREARRALDAIEATLPRLPARERTGSAGQGADSTETSRLQALLSRIVQVRRIGEDDGAVLDPLMREAHTAALALDLATARAAAERADQGAYQAALMRADRRVAALYRRGDRAVASVRQQIADAAGIELAPSLPTLGATLSELRALRANRSPLRPVPPDARP